MEQLCEEHEQDTQVINSCYAVRFAKQVLELSGACSLYTHCHLMDTSRMTTFYYLNDRAQLMG